MPSEKRLSEKMLSGSNGSPCSAASRVPEAERGRSWYRACPRLPSGPPPALQPGSAVRVGWGRSPRKPPGFLKLGLSVIHPQAHSFFSSLNFLDRVRPECARRAGGGGVRCDGGSAAVGGWAAGPPHRKAAQSLSRAVPDPEPKREATWRPVPPLTAPTRSPGPSGLGTHPAASVHPPGRSSPLGFLGAVAPARSAYPRARSPLRPGPPHPTPSRTVSPGASSPPPGSVREGKGAGSAGGVTAPARTSASCSLASVPCASWLFRPGRRRRFGAPVADRGDSPPTPQPSTHPRGVSPPSLASGCPGRRSS
ncbi:basic proline-rich protein-like [Artibeus jamaicensis]|uniref:basic proline-rich protein-like n=1 Tax=Artibeus jamaicensis TaxID=9417 RepID=UPI00235A7107|nr:basic proline-rich protein-like [Artibeus jamaicensis]